MPSKQCFVPSPSWSNNALLWLKEAKSHESAFVVAYHQCGSTILGIFVVSCPLSKLEFAITPPAISCSYHSSSVLATLLIS
jgi:hypothetical protein